MYKTEETHREHDDSPQLYEKIAIKKSEHFSLVANTDRRSDNWFSLLPVQVKWINALLQISRLVFCRGKRAAEHKCCVPKGSGCRDPAAHEPWAELPLYSSSTAHAQ